jgi:hypothetical protein
MPCGMTTDKKVKIPLLSTEKLDSKLINPQIKNKKSNPKKPTPKYVDIFCFMVLS